MTEGRCTSKLRTFILEVTTFRVKLKIMEKEILEICILERLLKIIHNKEHLHINTIKVKQIVK